MTGLYTLVPRSPTEEHRAATPLELFVDLCFVVAIAQAATSLHHALADNHVNQALIGFPMVFFSIWWAWIQFTWFASSYDNDDAAYRIATFVQVAGILVLAAGVPDAFNGDFGIVVIGYVIMRLGLVFQYLRAAQSDPPRRSTLRGQALAITILQLLWILFAVYIHGPWQIPIFLLLVAGELIVPLRGEKKASLPWHPHHIAERYGLLTIIVLGESILASVVAVQSATDTTDNFGPLILTATGAVVIVCSMWWLYFDVPNVAILQRSQGPDSSIKGAFAWAYGHYVIFMAAAAVGAGVAVLIDAQTHYAPASLRLATMSVGVPVMIYTVSMWALHRPVFKSGAVTLAFAIAILAVLIASLLELPIIAIGMILVGLIATNSIVERNYLKSLSPT